MRINQLNQQKRSGVSIKLKEVEGAVHDWLLEAYEEKNDSEYAGLVSDIK